MYKDTLMATTEEQLAEQRIYDFNVKQYEDHHKHLLNDMQEERLMERNVMLACGVFYSWLSTKVDVGAIFMAIASAVPIVITTLSLIRSNALINGVTVKAEYLRVLEKEIFKNAAPSYTGPHGWESYIFKGTEYFDKYISSQRIFWYVFLTATIAAAFAFVWISSGKSL